MRTHTKTIEQADYEALSSQIYILRQAATELSAANCFIDGLTEMRLWEYGLALKSLMDWIIKQPLAKLPEIKLVDIGAGDGLLGPALALRANYGITEIEPRSTCMANRYRINKVLEGKRKPVIKSTNNREPGQRWDVVFCTSVVEHVPQQDAFWATLADAVAPGGLLFLTTDVMPRPGGGFEFDNLRAINYTTDTLKQRGDWLVEQGFKWFGGEPDWEYHGNMAYDYSFMSMCLVKEKVQ